MEFGAVIQLENGLAAAVGMLQDKVGGGIPPDRGNDATDHPVRMGHRHHGILRHRQQVIQQSHLLDKAPALVVQRQGGAVKHPDFPGPQGSGIPHDYPAAVDFRSAGIRVGRLHHQGSGSVLGQNGFPVAGFIVIRKLPVRNQAPVRMGAEDVVDVILHADGGGAHFPPDEHHVVILSFLPFHHSCFPGSFRAEGHMVGIPVKAVKAQIFVQALQPVVAVGPLPFGQFIGKPDVVRGGHVFPLAPVFSVVPGADGRIGHRHDQVHVVPGNLDDAEPPVPDGNRAGLKAAQRPVHVNAAFRRRQVVFFVNRVRFSKIVSPETHQNIAVQVQPAGISDVLQPLDGQQGMLLQLGGQDGAVKIQEGGIRYRHGTVHHRRFRNRNGPCPRTGVYGPVRHDVERITGIDGHASPRCAPLLRRAVGGDAPRHSQIQVGSSVQDGARFHVEAVEAQRPLLEHQAVDRGRMDVLCSRARLGQGKGFPACGRHLAGGSGTIRGRRPEDAGKIQLFRTVHVQRQRTVGVGQHPQRIHLAPHGASLAVILAVLRFPDQIPLQPRQNGILLHQ